MERKGIVSFVEEDRKELRVVEEKLREELAELEFESEALLKEEFELEDEILRENFSATLLSLKDRNVPINDKLRIQLKKILQDINQKEKIRENELEYERDDEYER